MQATAVATEPLFQSVGPRPGQDEIHFTHAADGWRLALHRYRPANGSAAPVRGEPVLLHHRLGANATAFDLRIGGDTPSLARWLAAQGYDVWVPELRGSGDSAQPAPDTPRRWDWCVDDFIYLDDPAFLDYILAHSPHDRLHWIGHSLGGILLLCHCCLHGASRIASGTAIASGLDYWATPSSYRFVEPLKNLGRLLRRIPIGQISWLVSPLVGRWNNTLEACNCYPGSTAPEAVRAIFNGTCQDVSGEALHQLASLFSPSGLRSRDNRLCYSNHIDDVTTPMLLVSGDRDLQCHPDVIERTYRHLPGERHQRLHFGTEHGHAAHYGHFDLISGIHAEDEVYPPILAWLKGHRAG